MKTLPISTYREIDGKPVTTITLLRTCVTHPPQSGLDLTAIRARSRVLDLLDKADRDKGTELVFEDADFETARQAIRETRWLGVDRHIITFAELFGL